MMRKFTWSAVSRGLAAAALAFAASSAQAQCVGDCDENNAVTVDEIVRAVNLALMGGVGECPKADGNGDGSVTVDEIVTAVNNALVGCGTVPTPTPTTPPGNAVCGDRVVSGSEECDDGGFCAGGESAGKACDSESDCDGNVGACIGGSQNLRGCLDDSGCPGGECVKCRPVGGDGCAQNCTTETDLAYPYKPGTAAGLEITSGTGAVVQGAIISVPLPIVPTSAVPDIRQTLTVGKSRDGGPIPVSIKAASVVLPPIAVQSIACACVRGATHQTCGGVVFDENGVQALNCTPGFENPMTCPANRPCAPIHGAGNTASGFIGCTDNAPGYDILVTQDCNGTPGEPPLPVQATVTTSAGGVGSVYIVNGAAIGTVVGQCTGTAPDYGPDGKFCTGDDDPSTFGSPNAIPLTSGTVTGRVDNPVDFEGDVLGPFSVNGTKFQCNGNAVTTTTGTVLAGVFTSCDQPTIADIVVTNKFASNQ